jgi:hypothetical protein
MSHKKFKIHVFSVLRHPMLPACCWSCMAAAPLVPEQNLLSTPRDSLLGLQVTLPLYHEE